VVFFQIISPPIPPHLVPQKHQKFEYGGLLTSLEILKNLGIWIPFNKKLLIFQIYPNKVRYSEIVISKMKRVQIAFPREIYGTEFSNMVIYFNIMYNDFE